MLYRAYAGHEIGRNAQDEEMRALQRETGMSSQRVADLRERLNFQCFKYELLVDMVGMLRLHKLSSSCSSQVRQPKACSVDALHHNRCAHNASQAL